MSVTYRSISGETPPSVRTINSTPYSQSHTSRTTPTTNSSEQSSSSNNQSDTPSVDPQVRSRVTDIVQLAPTSNGESADAWGLSTGKEVRQYLTSELDDYYERNADHKIQPTEKARELVSTPNTP